MPLELTDHDATLRFWKHILKSPSTCAIRRCYLYQKSKTPSADNWAHYVHRLLQLYHLEEHWDTQQMDIPDRHISALVKRRFVESWWANDIINNKSLEFWRLTNVPHCFNVMLKVTNPTHRHAAIRLLTGYHRLESQRDKTIPRTLRRCKNDPDSLGNEWHTLFSCTRNQEPRGALTRKLATVGFEWNPSTWKNVLEDGLWKGKLLQKTRFIMIEHIAKFIYVSLDLVDRSLVTKPGRPPQ
jgi:hypothetical protein